MISIVIPFIGVLLLLFLRGSQERVSFPFVSELKSKMLFLRQESFASYDAVLAASYDEESKMLFALWRSILQVRATLLHPRVSYSPTRRRHLGMARTAGAMSRIIHFCSHPLC